MRPSKPCGSTRFSPRLCGSAALPRRGRATPDQRRQQRAARRTRLPALPAYRIRTARRCACRNACRLPRRPYPAALLEARGEARRRVGQLTAARADFTAELTASTIPPAAPGAAQLAILRQTVARRARRARRLAIAEAGDQPAALGQALAAATRPGCWTRPTAAAAPACCTGGRWHASSAAGCSTPPISSTACSPAVAARCFAVSPHATRGHVLAFLAAPEVCGDRRDPRLPAPPATRRRGRVPMAPRRPSRPGLRLFDQQSAAIADDPYE